MWLLLYLHVSTTYYISMIVVLVQAQCGSNIERSAQGTKVPERQGSFPEVPSMTLSSLVFLSNIEVWTYSTPFTASFLIGRTRHPTLCNLLCGSQVGEACIQNLKGNMKVQKLNTAANNCRNFSVEQELHYIWLTFFVSDVWHWIFLVLAYPNPIILILSSTVYTHSHDFTCTNLYHIRKKQDLCCHIFSWGWASIA